MTPDAPTLMLLTVVSVGLCAVIAAVKDDHVRQIKDSHAAQVAKGRGRG